MPEISQVETVSYKAFLVPYLLHIQEIKRTRGGLKDFPLSAQFHNWENKRLKTSMLNIDQTLDCVPRAESTLEWCRLIGQLQLGSSCAQAAALRQRFAGGLPVLPRHGGR